MAEANTQQQDYATIIGPDVRIKGSMSFEKAVKIQGQFQGDINTSGRLLVAREGKLEADVEASVIVVEGDAKGALVATDRLELKPTAHLEGDVRTPRLMIETGAIFSGHVSVGPDVAKDRTSRPAAKPVAAKPEPQPAR